MLNTEPSGFEPTTIYALHYLGGSGREWTPVATQIAFGKVRLVALDLPGFGDAAQVPGYSVHEMATSIAATIVADRPARWMLAGHSMGAKVAAVIARRAEDGAPELAGLAGLILVAGSPPSPEPMDDDKRAKMLGLFADDAETSRKQAREYVTENSGPQLSDACKRQSEADVLRGNRAAWVAWLESGSREDWSDRVGVLQMPTVIVAGADDGSLGPESQAKFMAPHFANARSVTLANAKHLLPMECAADVADLMLGHARHVAYRALIASNRVSRGTRTALQSRLAPDDPAYRAAALPAAALVTLRAVVDRVVPQSTSWRIDIAARIDADLHAASGDGWRFAELPSDAQAYATALATLDAASNGEFRSSFGELDFDRQDRLLQRVAAGDLAIDDAAGDATHGARFDAKQMRLWFEELRADAVKTYVAHPDTLARMGYSGIANGGDGQPKSGFARVGVGEREAWEPIAFSVRGE